MIALERTYTTSWQYSFSFLKMWMLRWNIFHLAKIKCWLLHFLFDANIAVYVLSNVNKHMSSSTTKRKRWCIHLSKLFFTFFVRRTPKQKRTSTFADFFSYMQNKQSTKCRKTGCQAISFAICFNFRKSNTYTKRVYVHHIILA